MKQEIKAVRGNIFDFGQGAGVLNLKSHFRYFEDGLLVISGGKVLACGDFEQIKRDHPDIHEIDDHRNCYIFPGFVDAHVHSVQTRAIASYGSQLLEWLEKFIFPNEKEFENPEFASGHTEFFIDQLLKNGTTTAAVFPSVHPASADAVFEISKKNNMRIICGNTWMDRNAPGYLIRDMQQAYDDSKIIIEKWHQKGRSLFAVTPRFALTSSPEALEAAKTLLGEYPDLYLQTHIAENKEEIEQVNHVHSANHNYLNIYDSYGLLNERTLLGHGIYLSNTELDRIAETGASLVHCPTSNLFLGSGLLDYEKILSHKIRLAIGSDVGAGTSFSMLQNLQDAYKISSLSGNPMDPLQAIYFITLGGARALSLDDKIGNFDVGKEADFVVIDPSKSDLLSYRIAGASSIEDILFPLIILSDDRIIKSVYLMGEIYNEL
jgi:guanine deaminase